jgi:hypothetical protein
MRKLKLVVAFICTALACCAAHAQGYGYDNFDSGYGGYTSQPWGNGGSYYNGYGADEGWSGSSQPWGNGDIYNFRGPQGQTRTCTTQPWGNGQMANCW